MDFAPDAVTVQWQERLQAFLDERVHPAEERFAAEEAELERTGPPWPRPAVVDELVAEARARGLWNLFLPDRRYGAGLTTLQYAPLAELSGRSPGLAPVAMNCNAPDTGNMELLALAGSEEQRARWLDPLLDGRISSAFCMTEPDVASSDATNIQTSIRRDGDDYVVNGRKWWSTGALAERCALLIVMGKTDPDAERHRQQSMVLVPADAPGVRIHSPLQVMGFSEAAHGGHAIVDLDDVRVPAAHLLRGEGDGFALAQERLGPGRVHHCMRLLGMAERALELACGRAHERVAFGRPLAEQGAVRQWVADARVRIDATRLLVLHTAWLMDTQGNRAAHGQIQAIKIAAPATAQWVIDRCMQLHGGAGVSQHTPLSVLWAQARMLRLADGPDEVHRDALGRRELRRLGGRGR